MIPEDFIEIYHASELYGFSVEVLMTEVIYENLANYYDFENEVMYVHQETVADFINRVDI